MNSKETRGLLKMISLQNLQGNWFRSFLIFVIMVIVSTFIVGLIPFGAPTQEQLMAAAETGDYAAMMKLFLPAEMTKKTVAAVCVVFFLSIFVTSPMNIGRCRFFLRVAAGQKGEMTDFFSAFADIKLVFSSIILEIIIAVATAFWSIIFFLAPIGAMMLAVVLDSAYIALLSYPLMLAAWIISILWCSRYEFARYILAEGKLGAFAAFGAFRKVFKGRTGELMSLRASYLLWDIASAFFTPLAYVYNTLFGAVYARYLYHIRGDIKFVSREEMERRAAEAENNEEKNEDGE